MAMRPAGDQGDSDTRQRAGPNQTAGHIDKKFPAAPFEHPDSGAGIVPEQARDGLLSVYQTREVTTSHRITRSQ
jgi:hypothetical protein